MNRLALPAGNLSRFAKKAAELLFVVVAILAISVPMFSQGAVGTILGGVYDTTGGAIAGAQVTITDVARGTTHVLMTDDSGQYTVPQLLAGTYSVKAEAKGFQTVENTNVLLEVSQSARVDLKLPPGQQSQTVTVTEVAPAINSTDATLGGTVTNTSVQNLPLVTRNFLQLLQLRPGVVDVPGGNGTSTTTNGRREGADVLLVEGVTQFDLATSNVLINGAQKGGALSQLPLDSVQEFSTQQNPPAEYGWRDGSAVQVAVKSGTNAIHGTAYAFGRDAAATDARQFALGGVGQVGNTVVENPGFTLGGPAIKDKLFWFVSAEFSRNDSFNTASITVPANVAGPGVGASIVDACNTLTANGTNPAAMSALSAQLSGITNWGQVGGVGALCIPQAASSTLENLWAPSSTGTFFPNNETTSPSNNGLAKVDYSPNLKHHFDGFVYIARQTQTAVGTYQPYWGTLGIGSTAEYAGAWTYTPNSRWVNDLRGGAAPNSGNSVAQDAGVNPAAAWHGPLTGFGFNSGVSGFGMTCITVNGITTASTGLGDCGKNGVRGPQYQLDFTDKVSYLRGNHAFKWGYEEVFVHFDDGSTANLNGTVAFGNLQSFLQGAATTANIISGDNTDHYRERWHAAFFQDTWRVSRRVTLTPGIRWEYIGSPHSTVDHMGSFDPNQPGGVIQVGPDLPNSTVIHPQKTNFNPRMGVAWDIFGNGKTVFRAGAGLLSSFPAILSVTGSSVPYGDTLCSVAPSPGQPCPSASIVINRYGTAINASTPNTFAAVVGNAVNPAAGTTNANWQSCAVAGSCGSSTAIFTTTGASATNGPTCGLSTSQCSMFVSNPHFKNPRSVQWNIDLQRAITNQLTLDVAYVGVHGYNEAHSVDLNEPALGTGWDNSVLLTATCLGATNNNVFGPGNTLSTSCKADTAAENLARTYNGAFPYFSYILQTQSGFISNYDALQMTLDSRNYHGLSFLGSYTYGHALDDWTKSSQNTSAEANPANPQYQYGNSDMDVRHRFRFSPTYVIPGKKSPGQMLEGWQISAIWALQTGFAWAPNDQSSNDWGGNGENGNPIARPNQGVWQSWNYSGPKSAFSNAGDTPIPCYGAAASCIPWAGATGVTTVGSVNFNPAIWPTCSAAAVAPYGNATLGTTGIPLSRLALAALTSSKGACYIQKGGILTPPAYGTLGNASRGLFTGPTFQNVDLSLQKNWHFKERYSAQLRIEVYNLFNHTNFAQFSDGSADPTAGHGSATPFGYATTGQQLSGISSNRQFQFGLRLAF